MIIHEHVRGQVPPPWFWALSGTERLDAFSQKWLPLPPASHLTGLKPAHVGPGSGTWTMPASGWLSGATPHLEISHLAAATMYGAAMSTLPPGVDVRPIQMHFNHFRLADTNSVGLVGKARVVNANRFFIYTEFQVEDAVGRQIMAGGGFGEIVELNPAPPAPPSEFPVFEEPSYATLDPWQRPVSGFALPSEWERRIEGGAEAEANGISEVQRRARSGTLMPIQQILGLKLESEFVDEGGIVHTSLGAVASEWLCLFQRQVDPGFIAALLNSAGWWGSYFVGDPLRRVTNARTEEPIGRTGLFQFLEIHRPLPADGRPIHIKNRWEDLAEGKTLHSLSELRDADGQLIATHLGVGRRIDATRRRATRSAPTRRALHTLLFTDIVDSTKQLERLGDAKWRELLDEHHRRIRSEIARCQGTEVKTQGDSFFVRFNSPALALDCARAACEAVKALGIEIRQGVHIGECEEQGQDLAGFAVHLASRIQGKAGAGEILVSGTVKDLVAGSGSKFADRGEHELKGIEGTWRLWALEG